LEYLRLGNNKISTIKDGAFEALVNLKTLYLNGNQLEEIPELPISTLEYLSFGNNEISTINDGAFEALVNLKTLHLWGNPFKCDCALSWMLDISTSILGNNEIQCSSPPEHSGKFIRVISREDLCLGEFLKISKSCMKV
ncbi:MAG: leucine-rich repeat domain-containing protein, partial [Kangiellaceae bacterium]|nr:leucine-rich repeat domain-containing protein [Kangiellaceae bacterium]